MTSRQIIFRKNQDIIHTFPDSTHILKNPPAWGFKDKPANFPIQRYKKLLDSRLKADLIVKKLKNELLPFAETVFEDTLSHHEEVPEEHTPKPIENTNIDQSHDRINRNTSTLFLKSNLHILPAYPAAAIHSILQNVEYLKYMHNTNAYTKQHKISDIYTPESNFLYPNQPSGIAACTQIFCTQKAINHQSNKSHNDLYLNVSETLPGLNLKDSIQDRRTVVYKNNPKHIEYQKHVKVVMGPPPLSGGTKQRQWTESKNAEKPITHINCISRLLNKEMPGVKIHQTLSCFINVGNQ